jgi:hypothetical protein
LLPGADGARDIQNSASLTGGSRDSPINSLFANASQSADRDATIAYYVYLCVRGFRGAALESRMTRTPFLLAAHLAAAICWIYAGNLESRAQEATQTWSDDLCENTIRFDPNKYDETAVRNTIHLLFGPSDIRRPMLPPSLYRQDLVKLRDGLNKDCANSLDRAKTLKFLPLQGIEDYRKALISGLEDQCQFESVKLRALSEPSALREYARAPETCLRYVEAMEGKSDLAKVFRDTVEKHCQSNGSPEKCVLDSYTDAQRAGGEQGMRLYLATFAWPNCAVKQMLTNANAAQTGELYESLENQFRHIFRVTQDHCEAPVDSHPELNAMATFETDAPPGKPATEWNIVAMGLFCGSDQVYPGRIVAYIDGIGDQRLRSGKPLAAVLDVDGRATSLTFHPYKDIALSPVNAGLVRDLLKARAASVRIINYKSPNPDRLKLADAKSKVLSNLGACFKP